MKMTKSGRFIFAIAFQVIVIFAIIIFKLSVLAGGAEILLRITPVDPTSPLRGDYATFQYDISNIYEYYLQSSEVGAGDTVYVILHQVGKYWGVERVDLKKPTDTNLVFIKGTVSGGGGGYRGGMIHVLYGVEEFFIPEGKGRGFNFGGKEAAASVVVDENGNAVLKRIYIDDKPWP